MAGVNTTSLTTQMIILHFIQNKEILEKTRADCQKHIVDPYLAEDATAEEKSGVKPIDFTKAMTAERTFDLEYFNWLFYET